MKQGPKADYQFSTHDERSAIGYWQAAKPAYEPIGDRPLNDFRVKNAVDAALNTINTVGTSIQVVVTNYIDINTK